MTTTRQEIQDEQDATERETARQRRAAHAHPPPPPPPQVEPVVVDGYVQSLLRSARTAPGDVGFPKATVPPWIPAVGTTLNVRQAGALADLDVAYLLATTYASEQKIQNYFRQMYLAFRVQMGAPVINP